MQTRLTAGLLRLTAPARPPNAAGRALGLGKGQQRALAGQYRRFVVTFQNDHRSTPRTYLLLKTPQPLALGVIRHNGRADY